MYAWPCCFIFTSMAFSLGFVNRCDARGTRRCMLWKYDMSFLRFTFLSYVQVRMYQKFAERNSWRCSPISCTEVKIYFLCLLDLESVDAFDLDTSREPTHPRGILENLAVL